MRTARCIVTIIHSPGGRRGQSRTRNKTTRNIRQGLYTRERERERGPQRTRGRKKRAKPCCTKDIERGFASVCVCVVYYVCIASEVSTPKTSRVYIAVQVPCGVCAASSVYNIYTFVKNNSCIALVFVKNKKIIIIVRIYFLIEMFLFHFFTPRELRFCFTALN